MLVRFLREHRSEWADYNVDAYSAASLKAGSYAFLGLRPTRFSGSQIIMPLAHTVENEEVCFSVICHDNFYSPTFENGNGFLVMAIKIPNSNSS